jgi:hypothetical protein
VATGHITAGLKFGEASFVFNSFYNKVTVSREEVTVSDKKFTDLLTCSKVSFILAFSILLLVLQSD